MKVKCKNIYNEHTKQFQDSDLWITIGKEYIVLEIEIYPGKDIFFRLVGDNSDKSPSLFDSKQFEIVSNRMPSNWKIYQSAHDTLSIGPESWQSAGFWEACYDNGDSDQLEIYKKESRIIFHEEGEY